MDDFDDQSRRITVNVVPTLRDQRFLSQHNVRTQGEGDRYQQGTCSGLRFEILLYLLEQRDAISCELEVDSR